ncbi:hypothetical protein COOONC_14268 [Cooperia oncophora]
MDISHETTYTGGGNLGNRCYQFDHKNAGSAWLRNTLTSRSFTLYAGHVGGAGPITVTSSLVVPASPVSLTRLLKMHIQARLASPEECMEMLVFETREGEVLARVSMEAICGSSRYFHGMFASDLFEKCSGRRRFLFCPEEEDCSPEDFTRFLHYLAGCRSQCTAISSAHTCVALIRLSDRYLCPTLSDFVCSPHGPVRRILTGETLPVFLPVVLLTQTHERSVLLFS